MRSSTMSTICPDPGRLRGWLDREAAPADDALAAHLAGCPACQTTLDSLSQDADFAAETLAFGSGAPTTATETERALASVRRRLVAPDPTALPVFTAPEPRESPLTPALSQRERETRTRRIPMPVAL